MRTMDIVILCIMAYLAVGAALIFRLLSEIEASSCLPEERKGVRGRLAGIFASRGNVVFFMAIWLGWLPIIAFLKARAHLTMSSGWSNPDGE